MAGWDAWPASLPRLVWDTEPIAVAKTEVIAELARAYGTAPPLLGLFSANGTTLPDFIHPPTDVEIRFSTPAMPQGRWVEQAWRCVFALEMPETLLLMLPPLNEGCWDDLLSTLLRSQLDVFVVLVWNGLNVDRLLPDHYFEGAPTRVPPIALAAYLESAVVDTLIALAASVNQEDSQGHRPLAYAMRDGLWTCPLVFCGLKSLPKNAFVLQQQTLFAFFLHALSACMLLHDCRSRVASLATSDQAVRRDASRFRFWSPARGPCLDFLEDPRC